MARKRRSIAGQPAMITGAASGIGRSLARLLSRTGASKPAIRARQREPCCVTVSSPRTSGPKVRSKPQSPASAAVGSSSPSA